MCRVVERRLNFVLFEENLFALCDCFGLGVGLKIDVGVFTMFWTYVDEGKSVISHMSRNAPRGLGPTLSRTIIKISIVQYSVQWQLEAVKGIPPKEKSLIFKATVLPLF